MNIIGTSTSSASKNLVSPRKESLTEEYLKMAKFSSEIQMPVFNY